MTRRSRENRVEAGARCFAPTADQRNTVKIMAGLGVPQDKICLSVVNAATGKPVSEPTLRRAFRREIDSGQTELITLVGNMLVNSALGRPSAVGEPIKSDAARFNAAIFLMNRAAGGGVFRWSAPARMAPRSNTRWTS